MGDDMTDSRISERWITDWQTSDRFPVYTRANAGEVLPDPCSPLGWTVCWEPGVVLGWRDSQVGAGTCDEHEVDLVHPEVVGSFGGYLYINGSMARLFGVRGPGLSPEMIDAVYFGAHPDVPPYVAEPWHDSPSNTAKLGEWMVGVMTADSLPHLMADQAESKAARASRPDLSSLDERALIARMRSFIPAMRRMFKHHLDTTAGTSIGPGALGQIAAALGDPSLALTLITSIGDVDSAAPSNGMWKLSRLPADSAEYKAGFAAFIDEFGSRGPNEWDIRSDVWETKPSLATSLIDAMRAAPDSESPEIRNERNGDTRRAAEAKVREALAPLLSQQQAHYRHYLKHQLAEVGVHLIDYAKLNKKQKQWVNTYFQNAIFPVLTPLAVDPAHPFPFISNLSLNIAALIRDPDSGQQQFARVKVPQKNLPRFVQLPVELSDHEPSPVYTAVPLEQVVAFNLKLLFPGMTVEGHYFFRVTRDADLELRDLEADDLMEALQQGLRKRRMGGEVVRLEVADEMPQDVVDLLLEVTGV